MRTTVNLDDQLLAQALELCGPLERTSLLKESLQALAAHYPHASQSIIIGII